MPSPPPPPRSYRLLPQLLAGLMGSSGGFMQGMLIGYSPVGLASLKLDPNPPFYLSDIQQALFGSLIWLSAAVSVLVAGPLTARFGRKKIIIACCVISYIGWLLMSFPPNVSIFLVGRVVTGFTGLCLPVCQLYLGEIAHKDIRGLLSSGTMIFLTFGTLLNYVLGTYINWRTLGVFNAAFFLIVLPLFVILPESPIWLLTKNRTEEAKMAYRWLRGPTYNIDAEIKEVTTHMETFLQKFTIKEIFRWAYLKPVFVLTTLLCLRMATGVYVVFNYTIDIFKSAEIKIDLYIATILVGVVQFVFAIVSAFLMDRLGRKNLSIASAFIMGICYTVIGAYHYLNFLQHPVADQIRWLPVVAVLLCIASFAGGLANSFFVLLTEMIPIRIKSIAAGIIVCIGTMANFAIVQAFPTMRIAMWDHGVFWFYAAVCFVLAAFCTFYLVETKGQSLSALERKLTSANILAKENPAFEMEISASNLAKHNSAFEMEINASNLAKQNSALEMTINASKMAKENSAFEMETNAINQTKEN
ncbi:unnamed protein product [Darwinula stevensoni]|uniref:Major facilitator superfamily (MFS) profile domain-containing protein n=1 Tax=Darwinula stevensoni TaxID=69355 RepID=A0A7R9AAS4_9CRUS|nr:unnamed protein product [Darwinula stevensoni]CAG0898716.1 unnamed protein product [Darwinula stevensoni]